MNFRVILNKGQFLFGKKISIVNGVKYNLNSDELDFSDLLIIATKIEAGAIESDKSASEIRTKGLEKAPQVVKEEYGVVVGDDANTTIEVVEAELDDKEEQQEEDPKNTGSGLSDELQDKVDKFLVTSTAIAAKQVNDFAKEGKEVLENILYQEKAGRNRAKVISAIEEKLGA